MQQALEKSFDFAIRIIELVKYLGEEKKLFPMEKQLLESVAGIGVCMRLSALDGKMSRDIRQKALGYAIEAEYLLKIMVETDYLTEKQSIPIITECLEIKSMIAE